MGPHNVETQRASQSIWRSEQQQEECSIGLVFGRGSAGFGALHDNHAFGRTHAPRPFSTALLQDHFEGRKSIGHGEGLAKHHLYNNAYKG